MSKIYPLRALSDFHLPCLDICLSGTPFSAAALAPPALRLCGVMLVVCGKYVFMCCWKTFLILYCGQVWPRLFQSKCGKSLALIRAVAQNS